MEAGPPAVDDVVAGQAKSSKYEWIKAYVKKVNHESIIELKYLIHWKILLVIVLGGIAQYIHNVMHNYVYYLAGEYKVYGGPERMLTDMGFMAMRDYPDFGFYPNFCLYLTAAISIAFGMTILFTRKWITNPNIRAIHVLWRALLVCILTIFLRSVSFSITIMPAPASHCSEASFDPPTTAHEIWTHFDLGDGCSDLIFSSHMMYGIIACLCVTHYTIMGMRGYQPSLGERLIKFALPLLCWCIVFLEAFTIVRQQVHYSIDVFTSAYAVPMAWIVVYHFVPKDPTPPEFRKAAAAKLNDSGMPGADEVAA